MFNPDPERYSCNSSRDDIHHSTPITVPSSKTNTPQYPVPNNTVPDTPAPLCRATVEIHATLRPLRMEMPDITKQCQAPMLTPMPGTNLSLEDIQLEPPEIVVSSPSVPLMDRDGYFTIPNGSDQKYDVATRGSEDNKTCEPSMPNCPQSQSNGGNAGRKDSLITKALNDNRDTYALDDDARKSLERKADFANAYLGSVPSGEVPKKLVRRRSTWSRHTGLYDGTGYASSECTVTEDHDVNATISANVSRPASSNADNAVNEDQILKTAAVIPLGDEASLPPTPASPGRPGGPGPTIDDNDKESLQEIIRAYAGYQDDAKNRRVGGAAADTDKVEPEYMRHELCHAKENNTSERFPTNIAMAV